MAATYPSTLLDLIKRVRRRLLTREDGSGEDHWSKESIIDALNWQQRKLYGEMLLLFEEFYFTKREDNLEPVHNRIDLPHDHKRTIAFEKNIGTGDEFALVNVVSPTRYQEFQAPLFPRNEGEVLPLQEVWGEFPGYLLAWGSLNVEGRYRLIYQHEVEDMQADNVHTTIPDDYQDLLVDGAAARLAADAGQTDRYAILKRDYDEGIADMKRTAGHLNLSKSHRIRNVRRSGFGVW